MGTHTCRTSFSSLDWHTYIKWRAPELVPYLIFIYILRIMLWIASHLHDSTIICSWSSWVTWNRCGQFLMTHYSFPNLNPADTDPISTWCERMRSHKTHSLQPMLTYSRSGMKKQKHFMLTLIPSVLSPPSVLVQSPTSCIVHTTTCPTRVTVRQLYISTRAVVTKADAVIIGPQIRR